MQREVWASQWRPAAGGQGSRTRAACSRMAFRMTLLSYPSSSSASCLTCKLTCSLLSTRGLTALQFCPHMPQTCRRWLASSGVASGRHHNKWHVMCM